MVKKINEYSDEGLLTLFSNAMNLIEKGQRVQEAEDVIKKIELEWEERLKQYLFADEKADRPSRGMLKTIGYAVGNDGVGTVKRQLLLDHLIQGTLPFCGSPAYMAEWGYPNSKKRYRKLRDVLNQLVYKNRNFQEMASAIIHWQTDLEYIKGKWKHLLD